MSRKTNHSCRARLRLHSFEERITPTTTPAIRGGFDFGGPTLQTNPLPGPSMAVGTKYTVDISNATIEWRTTPTATAGPGSPTSKSLATFFSALSPPVNATFTSPRVVWDQFADRFVVAVIENDFSVNTSRVLVAVTADTNPNNGWYVKSVGAAVTIGGQPTYASYLGLAVDEEAVYTTSTHLNFSNSAYADARVRILDKGLSGGWYSGSGGAIPGGNAMDPDATAGTEGRYYGMVPVHLYTDAGTAGTMGMFVIAYAGAQSGTGTNESVQLVTITNPLTAPSFAVNKIEVGDIDAGGALPDAPQPGSAVLIDTGAREVGNAVWRNGQLYFASVVNPNSGADAGQATVHWFELNTTTDAITDQGDVGESVAANLYTFSPSVAVDKNGQLAVGFSGSGDVAGNSQSLGAFYAGRATGDAAGTLRTRSILLAPSSSVPYVERQGGSASVWSPYSSMAIDPTSELTFWPFNAYADTAESTGTDPGRWATRGGGFSFNWPPDLIVPIADVNVDEDYSQFLLPDLDNNFSDYEASDVPPPGPLTYSVVANSNPALVSTNFPQRDILRLSSPANANGFANITVRATDAAGGYTDDVFILHVNPMPDPPVAQPDSYNALEDTQLSVDDVNGVLANDTDPDLPSDTLTVVLFSGPTHALSFNLDTSSGAFNYTATSNYNGPDSFTYKLQDSGGLESSIVQVSITVNPVNDPPQAVNDSLTLNEDEVLAPASLNVLDNDTDVDGPGPMQAQLVQGPAHAQFFLLHPNGAFDYTPVANYHGPDTFKYNAFDGVDPSATPATVSLTINPVDDPPMPQPDSYSVGENGTLNADGTVIKGVLFNDQEVDGETLSVTTHTDPLHGSLSLNADGTFSYTPTAGYSGPDLFTYNVTDGHSQAGPVNVNITVNPINDAPVAESDAYATDEDTLLSVTAPGVLANDSDVDSPLITAVLVQGPAHAALFNLSADGSFTYLPAANYYGPDSFTYHAFDGADSSNAVTVSLEVHPVQDPVVAQDDTATTAGKPVKINVLANDVDPDLDPLSVVSYTRPTFGQVSRYGSSLIYTPSKGATGLDSFSYTVTDGRGHSDTAMVSVTITDTVAPTVQAVDLFYGTARFIDLLKTNRTVLPWSGITKVSVVFSENVQAGAIGGALTLTGLGGNLPLTFQGYDAATRTATWTLGTPIGIDRVTLRLAAANVVDISGNSMAKGVTKTFGVLPGDYNGDGLVDGTDLRAIQGKLGKADRFADLDGSGIVDQADVTLATTNKGKRIR